MKSIAIEGTIREELGSKNARQLRNEGNVPCVIYGGAEPVHFYAPEASFRDLVYTPQAYTVEIKLGGQTVKAVMQEIQFHPVSDDIVHIDFIQLIDGKAVSIDVPVNLIGNARGVRNGGKLKVNLRKLRVRTTEENLPDGIDLNIEDLRIGQSIKVGDLPSEGFDILNTENAVIVSVRTSRNVVDEEEEEGEETEGEAAETEAGEEAASA